MTCVRIKKIQSGSSKFPSRTRQGPAPPDTSRSISGVGGGLSNIKQLRPDGPSCDEYQRKTLKNAPKLEEDEARAHSQIVLVLKLRLGVLSRLPR